MKLGVILCGVVDHKWQPTHEYDSRRNSGAHAAAGSRTWGADTCSHPFRGGLRTRVSAGRSTNAIRGDDRLVTRRFR